MVSIVEAKEEKEREMESDKLHIAMYPWLAMGHLTSFLHLANKLAAGGHRISFFAPSAALPRLSPFNRHPSLISLLPSAAAATTHDLPSHLPHLIAAMDSTRPAVAASLRALRPHLVFFDFAHWLPDLARAVDAGIRTVHYCTISPAAVGYLLSPERTAADPDLSAPPLTFPPSPIKLTPAEARALAAAAAPLARRLAASLASCDAIGFNATESAYADYVARQFRKPVALAGPVLAEPPSCALEERWDAFLSGFEPSSVVFCAFGSECVLSRDELEELVAGLELTGRPFLAAVRSPAAEEAEGARGLGVVDGGWVPQQLILSHGSVGCFVTHCGSGSLLEGLVSRCRLVLAPNAGDQIINARAMGLGGAGVGVEVERDGRSGRLTREGISTAVREVMSPESDVGKLVRERHEKWREFLLREGLEDSYIHAFVEKLRTI